VESRIETIETDSRDMKRSIRPFGNFDLHITQGGIQMRCKYLFITLLFLAIIFGCAKALGPGYLYQSGEMALGRAAEATDDEVKKKETEKALSQFNKIIEEGKPGSKWVNKAHFQVAGTYKSQYEWDKATEHYQNIVDTAPTGYLGGKARSEVANIRKNRKIIADNKYIYDNNTGTDEGNRKAAQALLQMAGAYEALSNYKEAINFYTKMVEEFSDMDGDGEPDNPQAPQAQFKVGSIYFYKLYDYKLGWKAFYKVREKFPDSYEASEAKKLLLKADKTLKEINQDIEDIKKNRSEMAIEYIKAGRKLRQGSVFGPYAEQVGQTYINIARNWEQKMRNFPNAVKAYEELVQQLPMEKFLVADALYQIGRLYQQDGQYEKAIKAYDKLFEDAPESTWRDKSVYNQAVCYEAIREFTEAYRAYKAYMGFGKENEFYREAELKVRVFENDGDGDGFPSYKEQEAGTSDNDKDDNPDTRKKV